MHTSPVEPKAPRPNHSLSLDLDLLDPSPFQPRKTIDPQALAAFAATLKAAGQLQPIAVRPKAPGRWEIVAGHRRTAAFKLLRESATTDEERRRFTLIKAVVVDTPDDRSTALAAYVENAAREALTPVEEGDALARLRELGAGMSAADLARDTGQAERRVRRLLRLSEAPQLVKDFVTHGVLVEVAGRGEAPKRERRALDLMAALEFVRLHAHFNDLKAATADERTTTAITRALTENWSLRRIQKELDRVIHKQTSASDGDGVEGPAARSVPPKDKGTDEPGPQLHAQGEADQRSRTGGADERSRMRTAGEPAIDSVCSSTSEYFTLHLTRLKAASRAQLEGARTALEDALVLLDAQLALKPDES